jgi:hypothetical protein
MRGSSVPRRTIVLLWLILNDNERNMEYNCRSSEWSRLDE